MIICKTQSRRSHMAFVVSNCHSLFIPTWSWPTARSRSKFQSCQASKPKLNNRLSFQQVPIIDNLNQNISQEPSRCLLDSSFIATELSPFLNMFWCSLSSPGSQCDWPGSQLAPSLLTMIKLSRINVTPACPGQTPHQWFRLIYESITQLESNTGLGKCFKHFIIC